MTSFHIHYLISLLLGEPKLTHLITHSELDTEDSAQL